MRDSQPTRPTLTRRSLLSPASPDSQQPTTLPSLPPLEVIALNRMAFGPRPGDLAAFRALGATDDARLAAYVDQQLAPGSIDDSALDQRLVNEGYTTLGKSLTQLWADHVTPDPPWSERMRPVYEAQRATLLRAIYSRRQLVEVLADFWHNHFNVYGWDYYVGPVFVHYDRDVIRTHLLGNFRQLLEAVATSTAMLYYLDNRTNNGGNPNENFARELFELHGLGAENYLGVLPQQEVPGYGQQAPIGYVDGDVYGATTCFTGWTVDRDTGLFEYDDSKHFPYQKIVLARIIPANQPPLKDGQDVLDMIAAHPGTARYVCRKLARRLIADDPPDAVVNSAAAVFSAHVGSPDQLTRVTRDILLSTAFRSTWGEKVKRPLEVAASALRAVDGEFSYTSEFNWWYESAGQPIHEWRAPNGFPDRREAWATTMPMLQRWRLINKLFESMDETTIDILSQTPPSLMSPTGLADYWIDRILGRPMPAVERDQLVEFLAQGRNPTVDLPQDLRDERLPRMVALLLMSPSFQWR